MAIDAVCFGRLQATSPMQKLFVHYCQIGGAMGLFVLFIIMTSSKLSSEMSMAVNQPLNNIKQIKPLLSERSIYVSDKVGLLHARNGQDDISSEIIYLVNDGRWNTILRYARVPPPRTDVVVGQKHAVWRGMNPLQESDSEVQRYFHLLRSPTGYCKKLTRLGGKLECRSKNETTPFMDGHKFVCLDPQFQIGGSKAKTSACLALSFGIDLDTSYDVSIRSANCEVHLFDTLDYKNFYIVKFDHFHIHKFGLGPHKHYLEYPGMKGQPTEVDTLENIAHHFGFSGRLVNILKIDIEGAEWSVLKEMINGSYLNFIGQIAIEVHAVDVATRDVAKQPSQFTRFKDILLRLEARGFRRVSYWDNINPKWRIKDKNGETYESAGELLLVNSKWYNEKFRQQGKKIGYNFKI